jgi:DNA topoisomerase VI, subunit B
MDIAEELAKQQRSISVAEFFEKNRQILGFDSAPRALITCVKEAVDNSLDACEDAGILPDIFVQIKRTGELYRVIVEDNGPGIVPSEIPRVFAMLLYGSRFHVLRQSRGQQGIGISAAVLYSQLTSGKPARITSRTSPERPARYVEVMINTAKNEPEIIREKDIDWERPRGTRVELEIEGSYVRGRRQSVYSYLKNVAIVNPHARITFVEPDGSTERFERATELLPKRACEIKPHPAGIELGELTKMLRYTERRKLSSFLKESFTSIGNIAAQEVIHNSGLDPSMDPRSLNYDQSKRLFEALRRIKINVSPCRLSLADRRGSDKIRPGEGVQAGLHRDSLKAGLCILRKSLCGRGRNRIRRRTRTEWKSGYPAVREPCASYIPAGCMRHHPCGRRSLLEELWPGPAEAGDCRSGLL